MEHLNNVGTIDKGIADDSIDRESLLQRTLDSLHGAWQAYAERLPEERSEWRVGAAYVRESSASSMTREAPKSQLQWVLDTLARRDVWVPWDAVYFDVASATSVDGRPAFKQLVERARRGDVTVIGAKASDRLFRSMADSQEIGDDLYRAGVEIVCEDKVDSDPRNAYAWQNEKNQELANAMWSRRTSEKVGKQLETRSAEGQPLGRLPEGFGVGLREKPYQGMQGKILSYVVNEPLASILVAGKELYLAGASFGKVAAWSADTDLKGVTPKGRRMNADWWRQALLNPKYAGHHMPSTYMGFKPGEERTPKRPRRKNGVTRLVACMLPPLWSLGDFERMVDVAKGRAIAAKDRNSYKSSLLSSIAIDERCDHSMVVHSRKGAIVRMACGKIDAAGRHSSPLRTEIVEAELDMLLSGLAFADDGLLSMVEEEVVKLAASAPDVPTVRVDPEIGRLHAALTALGDLATAEVSAPIIRRIDELKARDEERRRSRMEHVERYRASVDDLRHWSSIWATADIKLKNGLLKDAGIRLILGRKEGSRAVAAIRAIEVSNPIFGLALATALQSVGYERSRGHEHGNATPLVRLPADLQSIFARTLELNDAA